MVTTTLDPYLLPTLILRFSSLASTVAYRRLLPAISSGSVSVVVLARKVPTQLPKEKDNSHKKTQGPCNTATIKTQGCSFTPRLERVARQSIRFISREFDIKRISPFPRNIKCGHLRSAVRAAFPEDLPVEVELSCKTTQKLEKHYCTQCNTSRGDVVQQWVKRRLEPVLPETDAFVNRFKQAFKANVDPGWNRREYPYIPTGNATMGHSRCSGGSWNKEELHYSCRPVSIISSGKPRIVTLFSGAYTEILSPLHRALYSSLKRKGWLLVGPPTDERVKRLNGSHEYVSIDYSSATDNIRVDFVDAAVDVLISQADGLTEDQLACLRGFASLTFEDGSEASTGQPMGSVMSFPVLCLINKTVVDLALLDLLEEGKISFKEWTSHRCIINGDDLLYKELSPGLMIYDRIVANGSRVGLVVNQEKTLKHQRIGEINSTAFNNGTLIKKVNCAALFMAQDVTDVLGFARESSRTLWGFKKLVKRNLAQLEKQEVKVCSRLPTPFWRVLWRDRKISAALLTKPLFGKDERVNLFPVTRKPVGYRLERWEETDAVNLRVAEIRREGRKQPRGLQRPCICLVGGQKRAYVHRSKKLQEDTILEVLATYWRRKEWNGVRALDSEMNGKSIVDMDDLIVFDGERVLSRIDKLAKMIQGGRGGLRKPTAGRPLDVSDLMRSYGILDHSYISLE